MTGLSYGWWMDKHNRHHAHPNDVESDPDVAPARWSSPGAGPATRGRRRLLTRQAYFFFPLLTLEGLNLHVSSVRALPQRPSHAAADRVRPARCASIGYLAVVVVVLTPWQAIAFIAVHQALFGVYLGCRSHPTTRACRC